MLRRPPLLFIFAVTLTGILNNTLISPAIPDILEDFDIEASGAGILVAAGSVAGIVMALVVGVLADRYGRRIVLTSCLAVFGVAGTLAAFAPSFGFLIGARFLMGFGSAGLVNLAVVLIGDNWTGAERTEIVGRNAAVLTAGLAVFPLISGSVTKLAGWRVTLGLYTIAVVMAVVAWTILDGRRPEAPGRVRDQLRAVSRIARDPGVRAAVTMGFLIFVLIFGAFLTVFPLHLAEEFGMDAAARGLMIGLPAVGSTVVAFNLGRMRRVFSTRTVAVMGAVGFGVAFVTLGLATAVFMAGIAVITYGAAEGLLIPALQDLAMEVSSDSDRGSIMALWVASARLGQTIGPLLAGLTLAFMGTGGALVAGSSIAALLLLVALFGRLPKSDHRRDQATSG